MNPQPGPSGTKDAQAVPGMPSPAALEETDRLLDRLARRGPQPRDLDDPLAAALALMASEADVDMVPADRTRRQLSSAGAWPLRQDLRHVLDGPPTEPVELSALPAAAAPPADAAPVPAPPPAGPASVAFLLDRLPAAQERREIPVSSVVTPPPREVGVRLVPVLVVAAGALALSMGAAAALTSGESLNPANAVARFVQEISNSEKNTEKTTPVGGTSQEPQSRSVVQGYAGGSSSSAWTGTSLAPSQAAAVSPTEVPSLSLRAEAGPPGSASGQGTTSTPPLVGTAPAGPALEAGSASSGSSGDTSTSSTTSDTSTSSTAPVLSTVSATSQGLGKSSAPGQLKKSSGEGKGPPLAVPPRLVLVGGR
jgi:hypothetical protein